MKLTNKLLALIFAVLFILPVTTFAQEEENKDHLCVNADLVSTYIWRGVQSSGTPNFQPYMSLCFGNFTIGAAGSTDFIGAYNEVDFYLSYTVSSVTFTLNDYYWSDFTTKPYFNFKSEETGHIGEFVVNWAGTESLPLSLTAGVMFWGDDKKYDFDLGVQDPKKNNYSTYIEAAYNFTLGNNTLSPFIGVTPGDGMYGDGYGGVEGFAVVNLGFTGKREIKITDSFSLPVRGSVIFNPQAEQAFFVFGISF